MLQTKNIENLLPQRAPFVMIDGLMSSTETTTTTMFGIRTDNIFVVDGVLREPGLIENIAQTAAARAGYISKTENKPVMVGYIAAINNLQVFALPRTGDELITEITIENQIFAVSLITGKITCNDQLIAQCSMKIFINQNKNS
ncbi:MAG TPA: 3-hydroxyacyl-ACP dehydratase [Ferruginibacter sp.]|nr:3-hydroxyacyl-ACP dehydratase [Ferruginibacter sp.]